MMNHSINTAAEDSESDRDVAARHAGQLLYSGSNSSSTSRLLESGSNAGSMSWMVPENQRACCGIMSPVRRTFCLLTLFDLILTFILWVIYTQVIGDSFYAAFAKQVVHYTFKTSLFDTVLCAAWRFVPLLLAYALFRLNTPWVVAITTSGTCVFLLCKVFIYKFSKENDNIICYLLLVVSFITAWIETWFLDFKVLPREQKARERGDFRAWRPRWTHRLTLVVVLVVFILPLCLLTLPPPTVKAPTLTQEAYLYGAPSERTPLLQDGATRPAHPPGDLYYSPVNSPVGSDDEEARAGDDFRSIPGSRGRSRNTSRGSGSLALSLGAQEQEFIKQSRETWDKVWEMIHTTDGWKLESDSKHATPKQGCVHSRVFGGGTGKVFRLQTIINSSPKSLFNELVLRVTESPKWTSTVIECRTLNYLDDSTSILYNVAAEAAGGIVSSRDFVNLVHYATRDGVTISAASAVTTPEMPPTSGHVRGENGPGGLIFKPVPGHPNRCLFISIINTDLKGWIPQSLVDRALSGVLINYSNDIQRRMAALQRKGPRR